MQKIDDDQLKNINGGMLKVDCRESTLLYSGSGVLNTKYRLMDYELAWDLIRELQARNLPEDEIIARLIANGYIQQ